MKLHIEGMGIVGCLLALKLEQRGRKFTWHDTRKGINAWQASTGCIYPSGDVYDNVNYADWARGYFGKVPELEYATYCFLSKHPPHGAKYEFTRHGVWGVAGLPSMHLNAQQMVLRVREHFRAQEAHAAPKNSLTIVAHGFSERMKEVLWGWAVKVRLSPTKLPGIMRHCLYMRVGRFKLAYAYPVPLEPEWYYAGSSLIVQKEPHSLDIDGKLITWERHVREYTGLRVLERGVVREGWRPRGNDDEPLVRSMKGRLVIRPHWNSGIRHAPAIVNAVLERI